MNDRENGIFEQVDFNLKNSISIYNFFFISILECFDLAVSTSTNNITKLVALIVGVNSDTLFLSILILKSQCVGVAIEGIDIWYMVVTLSDRVTVHGALIR